MDAGVSAPPADAGRELPNELRARENEVREESQGAAEDQGPAPRVLAVLGVLAALHALLPYAVARIVCYGGISAGELAVVGMHVFGPLVYLPLYRRARLSWLRWVLVVALNHGLVLLGAVPYLL